jgi:hypothetical protein
MIAMGRSDKTPAARRGGNIRCSRAVKLIHMPFQLGWRARRLMPFAQAALS